ncbi:MAG: hypothetical protein ACJA08_002723 [Cyclobacteriaceae bacterium]|jgi:hypothetical protein
MGVKPKYRNLSTEELQELEKEFVDFLILNGITADKWIEIKETDKDAADDLITLFSDVVLAGVLRKVKFLEFRSKLDLKTFHCLDQKIVLVGMKSTNESVDFTNPDFINASIQNTPPGIKVYTTDKTYHSDRQQELFQMIQSGCLISDGKLFKALSMCLAG